MVLIRRCIALALMAGCNMSAWGKVRTMQVTLGAAATPMISSGDINFKWVIFQNNSTHTMRLGDANITTSRGLLLLAGPAGGSYTQQPFSSPQTGTLAAWYVFGTAGDVLDIIYDDGTL